MKELCSIKSGKSDTVNAVENGAYAFFDRSKKIKRSNRYLFDCEALIIAGEGAEFLPKYYLGKFDLHQRAYALHNFSSKLDVKYLYYYLHHVKDYFPRVAVGATVKSLRLRHFEDLPIVLFPLPTQQKIVAKLDAIFAEIDKAKAAAEANAKNAEALISSQISKLFNELKDEIGYVKLGDICSSVEYGSSSKSEAEGKVPVLRMGNILNGKLDYSDLVFTNNEDEIKKYQLSNGDVLFNRTNSPLHVGKSAAFYSTTKTIFAGYLIRINYDKKKVIPEFLTYYLNSKEVREYGYTVMSHSINQANINGSKLKDYPFVCPSIEVQKIVVDAINSIKIHTDFLAEYYAKKIKDLNLYKNSILKQAFNGGLVKE